MKPTKETYTELQLAYDFFNEELFASELPNCLITLQRKNQTHGYFSSQRFVSADGKEYTDEIALNPDLVAKYGVKEAMQTLVHEMCHMWQYHFGKVGRRSYHNKEWAHKMISVGLMPSPSGRPHSEYDGTIKNGKPIITGDSMADYAIEGGVFEVALEKLLSSGNFELKWRDVYGARSSRIASLISEGMSLGEAEMVATQEEGEESPVQAPEKPKPTRCKYQCPTCKETVYGRRGGVKKGGEVVVPPSIICGTCNVKFEAQD